MDLASGRDDYTFEEWLKMDNNEKLELIDGTIYMKGDPSRRHQKVSTNLIVELGTFLKRKKCELYHDPFMVQLSKETVVRPDISVICDENKFTDRGCVGAPDLIGDYEFTVYRKNDIIPVYVLPDCKIDLSIIFPK